MWAASKRVWWLCLTRNRLKTLLGGAQGMGMAVDIKLICFYGCKHFLGHVLCAHAPRLHRLAHHGLPNELAICLTGACEVLRTIPLALTDTRWHEVRTEHTGADLLSNQT